MLQIVKVGFRYFAARARFAFEREGVMYISGLDPTHLLNHAISIKRPSYTAKSLSRISQATVIYNKANNYNTP